jgi:hypothetical protein
MDCLLLMNLINNQAMVTLIKNLKQVVDSQKMMKMRNIFKPNKRETTSPTKTITSIQLLNKQLMPLYED